MRVLRFAVMASMLVTNSLAQTTSTTTTITTVAGLRPTTKGSGAPTYEQDGIPVPSPAPGVAAVVSTTQPIINNNNNNNNNNKATTKKATTPKKAQAPTTITAPIPKETTTKQTTGELFKEPSPIDDPAPSMMPTPADEWLNNPSPFPDPSPAPVQEETNGDGNPVVPKYVTEPAPETTEPHVFVCAPTCFTYTCDALIGLAPSWTCDRLESAKQCDCSGCACEPTPVGQTAYSCLNACSDSFDTCSCEQGCEALGNCCDDYSVFCSDFDFSQVSSDDDTSEDNVIGIVVGVGIALLVVGAVGGFFVTRRVLLSQRMKRENELLKAGNANLDASYNAPMPSHGATKSEFGLL